MPNNRIFYAVQAVHMKPCKITNGTASYGTTRVLRGLQSVGIQTNFNLEQVYQLGQLELYDNVEEVPEIEVSLSKVIDGRRPLYLIANDGSSDDANNLTLTQISDRRCDVALGIWSDTATGTSGTATYYVVCTGMYVSNVTYNLVTDGNLTEDLTLVGNHKKWNASPGHGGITGVATGVTDSGDETKRVAKRWAVSSNSTVPYQVVGVANSGGTTLANVASSGVHFNTMTLTCNLGRESINELGRRSPYYRYINFPVEVTAEIEVTATQGDNVDADDFGSATGCGAAASGNLYNGTIKVEICDTNNTGGGSAYIIDLGAKNKLTSVNYTGGDTGGGNVTISYSFQTFNDVTVSGLAFA
jgi:hypothetical protein